MSSLGIKVEYAGELDQELDSMIKHAAKPGIWWAQGYDFGTSMRDICFDYKRSEDREQATSRILKIKGTHLRKHMESFRMKVHLRGENHE